MGKGVLSVGESSSDGVAKLCALKRLRESEESCCYNAMNDTHWRRACLSADSRGR